VSEGQVSSLASPGVARTSRPLPTALPHYQVGGIATDRAAPGVPIISVSTCYPAPSNEAVAHCEWIGDACLYVCGSEAS
jgi:hypothetical protein